MAQASDLAAVINRVGAPFLSVLCFGLSPNRLRWRGLFRLRLANKARDVRCFTTCITFVECRLLVPSKQVNMLWHHNITHDHEPITLAGLFQHRNEGIAASRRTEKWQSPITRAGNKVQVMSAVGAMQAAGHDKPHGIGCIVPALAKNARTGHPQFRNGKEKHGRAGIRHSSE